MEQIEREKLQQKVNGQEDHLTKASTGSKRRKGLLQEWFGDTGTIGKDDERREGPSGINNCGQVNQSAKSSQKNRFFLRRKSVKQKDMHRYKFGVKSPCSMKLHPENKSSTGIVEGMVKQTWSYQKL
ncbi:hypothetical protein QL285_063104 [Trifolium repens]|nr:hypothetical protein QL285_063104 [Trifolium repens]